jgi:pyrimidine deaminase RibD-like protein
MSAKKELSKASDRNLMVMAIDLARKCKSEPRNISPKVGAIAARDGRVLGDAFRGELAPGEHAEFPLLEGKLADQTLAGATLFTTLEPCTSRNHPKIACADRIIERRIKRVVIGVLDPNHRIRGRGELSLRAAGIEVTRFDPDLMSEIEELNRDFARAHPTGGRRQRTKAETTDPVKPGELGPNGHRIGYGFSLGPEALHQPAIHREDNLKTEPQQDESSEARISILDGGPVYFLKRFVDWIGKWSSVASGFHRLRDYAPESQTLVRRRKQVRRVDMVLVIWWVVPVLCYGFIVWRRQISTAAYLCLVPVALRIINIVSYNLRVALVETNEGSGNPPIHGIISAKRSLTLGMINFCELIVCFACVYAAFPDSIHYDHSNGPKDSTLYWYFSCITQLTIGYGDVYPLNKLRLVACIQGLSGLLLITLTISRMISLATFHQVRDGGQSS